MELKATMVANEFIDRYMAAANGEYVKVYLYLLRYQGQVRDLGEIADALNHTEADVKRALGYWVRQGVLAEDGDRGTEADLRSGGTNLRGMEANLRGGGPDLRGGEANLRGGGSDLRGGEANLRSGGSDLRGGEANLQSGGPDLRGEDASLQGAGIDMRSAGKEQAATQQYKGPGAEIQMNRKAPEGTSEAAAQKPARSGQPTGRKLYTPEQVSRLADQEEFTQLLYIAQKYMNKVFTPRECEVFAYLYDGLHMPGELLEYLVEYCVQNGHYSIRYMESVALNWHERGIVNVAGAREYTAGFSREGFAVMRAFGISDRRPGDSEQELIRKWFQEFGFTRELVLEACSRTLKAIHKPSFSYADKILTDWESGGVRVMEDVRRMDEQREGRRNGKTTAAVKPAKNQFHNFEQRNTDYDAMVLERLKERLSEEQK